MTDKNLTISQIAALLRKKKLSPVELARELLHRIERLQPKLNAFITVTADLALRQAREAEREIVRGEYRGLHSHSGLRLRHRRAQAHTRPRSSPRSRASVLQPRPCRAALPFGGGYRYFDDRDRGKGSPRSRQFRRAWRTVFPNSTQGLAR